MVALLQRAAATCAVSRAWPREIPSTSFWFTAATSRAFLPYTATQQASSSEPWAIMTSSAPVGTPTDLILMPNWLDQNAGTATCITIGKARGAGVLGHRPPGSDRHPTAQVHSVLALQLGHPLRDHAPKYARQRSGAKFCEGYGQAQYTATGGDLRTGEDAVEHRL